MPPSSSSWDSMIDRGKASILSVSMHTLGPESGESVGVVSTKDFAEVPKRFAQELMGS